MTDKKEIDCEIKSGIRFQVYHILRVANCFIYDNHYPAKLDGIRIKPSNLTQFSLLKNRRLINKNNTQSTTTYSLNLKCLSDLCHMI